MNQNNNSEIQTPTLFIGGLSYQSTSESITDFFSSVGEVLSARVITDKETGKVNIFLFSQEDLDMYNFVILIQLDKHLNNLINVN